METFKILMIVLVVLAVVWVITMVWDTRPKKCPRCGETMSNWLDNEDCTTAYRVCPKCGYMERMRE